MRGKVRIEGYDTVIVPEHHNQKAGCVPTHPSHHDRTKIMICIKRSRIALYILSAFCICRVEAEHPFSALHGTPCGLPCVVSILSMIRCWLGIDLIGSGWRMYKVRHNEHRQFLPMIPSPGFVRRACTLRDIGCMCMRHR